MSRLADVIDLAINEYLWDGHSLSPTYHFSCVAVYMSCGKTKLPEGKAESFLQSLGCKIDDSHQFIEIQGKPKRQYARALWLTFAAMIAREEDL